MPYNLKVKVNDIQAFVDRVKKFTEEDNPEVTFECVNNSLFPRYWEKLEARTQTSYSSICDDGDPDCYCE